MNSIMETVCQVCAKIRNSSRCNVSFQNLLTMLRREFRERDLDLKIKSERDHKLDTIEFYVNAYYDSEDDQNNETPIEIIVHHNFDKTHLWDTKQVSDLLVQVFDAVVHEYKHRRQSIDRKHITYSSHIKSPYDEYLADPDELDAYAISIAIELCRSLGKFRALRYMGRFHSLGKLRFQGRYVSPCLASYFGQFDSIQNPIMKRLAKKVYVRLMKVDTDHIFM